MLEIVPRQMVRFDCRNSMEPGERPGGYSGRQPAGQRN